MTIAMPFRRAVTLTPPWVRDPLWRNARAVPTLDLRFADNKSLTDAVTGASLVTFTRSGASGGTYVDSAGVLQTAATDVPRFDHNPTTGESLGLLVEEARTNLLQRSEEFDNASWGKTRSSVTANATTSPAGTLTADKLVEDTTASNSHQLVVSPNTASGIYTCSVYAKAAERTQTAIRLDTGVLELAIFNLSTGTVISTTSGITSSITPVGNGWYRLTATLISAASVINVIPQIAVGGTNVYTGDGTSGIYVWGAQLEAGAFPTSYIKNIDTALGVTRSADVVSITGSAFSSWYNATQGSLHAEYSIPFDSSASIFPLIAGFSDNTLNNSAFHYNRTIDDGRRALVRSGGVTSFDQPNAGAYVYGQIGRQAFAYTSSEFAFSAAGVSPTVSSSITWPTVDRFGIGHTAFVGGALSALNGTIRRLTFWPQRLANSTLQAITQ